MVQLVLTVAFDLRSVILRMILKLLGWGESGVTASKVGSLSDPAVIVGILPERRIIIRWSHIDNPR